MSQHAGPPVRVFFYNSKLEKEKAKLTRASGPTASHSANAAQQRPDWPLPPLVCSPVSSLQRQHPGLSPAEKDEKHPPQRHSKHREPTDHVP